MSFNDTVFSSFTNASVKSQSHTDNSCPDSLMTFQTFYTVDRTVSCGLVPCLFLLGAPANILSMIVFYRQGLRDRMNLCLFCLAFTDLMYVTVLIFVVSYCFIGFFLPEQELFWKWSFTIHSLNLIYGFAYSSGCLTMIIAVERCVCVMFPMKAATLISTKTMAIILSVTLLLIQVMCGVYVVKQTIVWVRDDITGENVAIPVYTDLFLSHSIFKIVENVMLSFISFFSFTSVFLATVGTVIRLHTAQTWRKSTASSQMKGQGMLMRMLVAVSCVYIFCTAPNVALALARFTVPEFRADGSYCNLFTATHLIGFVIFMFNSSINFFVYFAMSSRFRQELSALCPCSQNALSSKGSVRFNNIKNQLPQNIIS